MKRAAMVSGGVATKKAVRTIRGIPAIKRTSPQEASHSRILNSRGPGLQRAFCIEETRGGRTLQNQVKGVLGRRPVTTPSAEMKRNSSGEGAADAPGERRNVSRWLRKRKETPFLQIEGERYEVWSNHERVGGREKGEGDSARLTCAAGKLVDPTASEIKGGKTLESGNH